MMRVTSNMMVNTITRNLFIQSERLLDAQTKVSTGKEINQLSDDPTGMAKILNYRSKIAAIEQYGTNVGKGMEWLELSETTLEAVTDYLDQVIEIAEEYAMGDWEGSESAAESIKSLYDQIMQLANTTSADGSYLFSGNKTSTAPFSRDDLYNATYNGNDGKISIITGEGSISSTNVNGSEVFIDGGNIFDIMKNLISCLENSNTSSVTEEITSIVEQLNDAMSNIQDKESEVAIKYSTLELKQGRLADLKNNIEGLRDNIEAADIYTATIELQTLETSYETCLEVAAMINSQSNLFDFL